MFPSTFSEPTEELSAMSDHLTKESLEAKLVLSWSTGRHGRGNQNANVLSCHRSVRNGKLERAASGIFLSETQQRAAGANENICFAQIRQVVRIWLCSFLKNGLVGWQIREWRVDSGQGIVLKGWSTNFQPVWSWSEYWEKFTESHFIITLFTTWTSVGGSVSIQFLFWVNLNKN